MRICSAAEPQNRYWHTETKGLRCAGINHFAFPAHVAATNNCNKRLKLDATTKKQSLVTCVPKVISTPRAAYMRLAFCAKYSE